MQPAPAVSPHCAEERQADTKVIQELASLTGKVGLLGGSRLSCAAIEVAVWGRCSLRTTTPARWISTSTVQSAAD